ncbi:MAG: winged helix-turn-helix domain-containing protein [Halioglobus sp.]
MFVLRGLLRAESQEKILIYLLVRETGYGKAIAEFYCQSQNAVQKQLARLEEDGIVVSRLIGRLREYELNPRYPFLKQLKPLLKAALKAYPDNVLKELTMERSRPRQPGKPTMTVR